jgi:hypothetical protein
MKRLCLLIVTKKNENCPVLNIIFSLVIPACLESFFECRKDFGQAEMTKKCRGIFR